jgi:hypothetical protein
MAQISTEQALQIPQQLRQKGSQSGSGSRPDASADKKLLSDDDVTLLRLQANPNIKKLKVENYKSELGQDSAFVKETLKVKLGEYNLNPNTQLKVGKNILGNIEIKGALLQSDLERISADLNNNTAFKESFNRLSQQQPTLNYVDNVVKISSAYGVGNNLFNTLLSDDNEFNKLNDIAHRYETLKNNTEKATTDHGFSNDIHESFQYTLNA